VAGAILFLPHGRGPPVGGATLCRTESGPRLQAACPWSSAAAHCGTVDPDACLEMAMWRQHWSKDSWRKFLSNSLPSTHEPQP
jgi:hypothetical protein